MKNILSADTAPGAKIFVIYDDYAAINDITTCASLKFIQNYTFVTSMGTTITPIA
jgi:hypothetical protein